MIILIEQITNANFYCRVSNSGSKGEEKHHHISSASERAASYKHI
jgi:hypothetical protein